jgi:hypothetical protein
MSDAAAWRGDEYAHPFDADYNAKPAYYGIQEALEDDDNISIPTGLLDEADNAGFILYPNPCASFLTLARMDESNASNTMHLDFYSVTGALLNTIHNYKTGNPIDVSAFANTGFILMRVSDAGRVVNLKFFKQPISGF